MAFLDKKQLLTPYHGEKKALLARVLDLVEIVLKSHQPKVTVFYDQYHAGLVQSFLKNIPDIAVIADGGYSEAERSRLVIFPDYLLPEQVDANLAFLKLSGQFKLATVSHRDYLGSLMGLGLKREKIGDIIVCGEGAYIIVDADIAPYIQANLHKIGKVPVEVEQISSEQLQLPTPNIKVINTTVASLRVDAVAAAGYGLSRSKIVPEIRAEKLSINWCPCSNPAATVQEGDMLSLRGRGRVKVAAVKGNTKKGRVALELHKYI